MKLLNFFSLFIYSKDFFPGDLSREYERTRVCSSSSASLVQYVNFPSIQFTLQSSSCSPFSPSDFYSHFVFPCTRGRKEERAMRSLFHRLIFYIAVLLFFFRLFVHLRNKQKVRWKRQVKHKILLWWHSRKARAMSRAVL